MAHDDKDIKIEKRVYAAQDAYNALDGNFREFLPPPRTVSEFFEIYNEYFYILPEPTHTELRTRSQDYAWPDWENPRLAEIRNLEKQIEILQEQIDSIEKHHPFIANHSCLYPVNLFPDTDIAITSNQIYYMHSAKLRRIMDPELYKYVKNKQTFRQTPKPSDENFQLAVDSAFIDSIPPGPPMVSQEDFRKTTLEINRYNGNGQIIDITNQVQSAD